MLTPILMYHRVATQSRSRFRPFTISPTLLAEHIACLHDHGCTILSVSEWDQVRRAPPTLNARYAVLTFDDGFADFLYAALPVLQDVGISATLYVTTGYVGGRSEWLRSIGEGDHRMLSWDEVRICAAAGIEIGAHSVTHAALDTLPDRTLSAEIVESKAALEHQLGIPATSFAYPFGYYDRRVVAATRHAGFQTACAVADAFSSDQDSPLEIRRIKAYSSLSAQALAHLLVHPRTQPPIRNSSVATYLWRSMRRLRSEVERSTICGG